MIAKRIAPDLYGISLGIVNAFLIDSPDGCALIDTGTPGNEEKILGALAEIGKAPGDLKHILLTHAHPDHMGSVRALQQATGARTYLHPLDVAIAERGLGFRPLKPAPGVMNRLLVSLVISKMLKGRVPPVAIDVAVEDGTELPIAGGITAIHSPGHCAGHLAYLWPRHGGILFVGDACGNIFGVDWSIGYEDIVEGERSLNKLAACNYEIACFGHGKALRESASRQIWRSWHAPDSVPRGSV